MRTIYIEFTRPHNTSFPLVSFLIRLVQRTKYSHVRLRWMSTSGISIIYEAGGISVRVKGEVAENKNPSKILKKYAIEVTEVEYKKLIQLLRFAGISYGFKQLVGIALVHLFGLKKNPLSEGRKSQVCSELVGLFLQEVKGWDLQLDLDIAGPLEIDKYLMTRSDAKRII